MEHVTALVDNDATPRPTNVYAIKARNAKASKLANVLVLHGATSVDAAALPPSARLSVAALAGTRPPSATTWALVVDLVAVVERNRVGVPLAERLDDHAAEERAFARL